MVTANAAAMPDTVSLLEQVNPSPDTWFAGIDLTNAFFSITEDKTHQKQFAYRGQGQQYTLLSHLSSILTLKPCVTIHFTGSLVTFPFGKISH